MKFLERIMKTIVLPKQISAFEETYLRRMNRVALVFFVLHIPVFVAIAAFNDTGPLLAGVLTSLVVAGPVIATVALRNPRTVSLVFGFTAMLMGGLLVHFGQGPMQIEMHFYFFALIAMLAIFGNPLVILTAAATVALHHLVLFLVLPSSVFNYEAAIWVVVVHAVFVVVESIATVFIARSFFDNVIGLEKIVMKRTSELDARNHEMRRVLDNVDQALLVLDREQHVLAERSAMVESWFGPCAPATRFGDYLRSHDARFADMFELGFSQLDVLPIELALFQMPDRFRAGARTCRVKYMPIADDGNLVQLMVVISDVTVEDERGRLEAEQHEVMSVLDRVISDRSGFVEYVEEAEALLLDIVTPGRVDLVTLKRAIHTLKGNSLLFGVLSIGGLCQHLEDRMEEELRAPDSVDLAQLTATWDRLKSKLAVVLDDSAGRRIDLTEAEFDQLLACALREASGSRLAQMIADLKLEPTARRLARVAEQAKRIAARLGKGDIAVDFDHQMLRLDPQRWQAFWSAFVHIVRNAVDHGLETPDERIAAGKRELGGLVLRTALEGEQLVISLTDDGRGIAWDAVRARAERMGLPSGTQVDLEEALFHDGLSTRSDVTEVSGRGVGLAAVRAACLARGGEVRVRSSNGGTTFEFRFSAREMAPTATDRIAA